MCEYVVGAMGGDVGFGESMVPEFEEAVSSAGGKDLFRGRMPLYLIAIFDVCRNGEHQLSVLGVADMETAVHAAGDEERVLIGAFD
jgi:hypothetical protein